MNDDGCASPRFESSIHKQIKKYTLMGVFLYLVGMTGFEPAAFASRTQRSTKLSHIPAALNIIAQPVNFFKTEIEDLSSGFSEMAKMFSQGKHFNVLGKQNGM